MKRKKILFLQLPHLDNDADGVVENIPFAAGYLIHSMEKAGLGGCFSPHILSAEQDLLDDGNLLKKISAMAPEIVAFTLFVWNVERSLRLMKEIKRTAPKTVIMTGGPEVAPDHPFLFNDTPVDYAVSGEGEPVFPEILRSVIKGTRLDFASIGTRKGRSVEWGRKHAPVFKLNDILPPPGHWVNLPDHNGMAYMETSRGCPLRCAFCCYNQRRRSTSFIDADQVEQRIAFLKKKNVREIRFVDPTFNSNPEFEEILRRIVKINADKRISFFAELRAETLTGQQVRLLKTANFTEIEVGVQSLDIDVLKAVRRPSRIDKLKNGIQMLSKAGIRQTIDIMNGLPGQTVSNLKESLKWVSKIRKGRLQFLHTLLIPGTELRDRRKELGLVSQARPPYRVISTRLLSGHDMLKAEEMFRDSTGTLPDCPTRVFIGRDLPDLFKERIKIDIDRISCDFKLPGSTNRRALIISGKDLFAKRNSVLSLIRKAISDEPFILWQFVIAPASEEPLDLFEAMISEIDDYPRHFIDMMTVVPEKNDRVARRIMVLLRKGMRYGNSWRSGVGELLSANFY